MSLSWTNRTKWLIKRSKTNDRLLRLFALVTNSAFIGIKK